MHFFLPFSVVIDDEETSIAADNAVAGTSRGKTRLRSFSFIFCVNTYSIYLYFQRQMKTKMLLMPFSQMTPAPSNQLVVWSRLLYFAIPFTILILISVSVTQFNRSDQHQRPADAKSLKDTNLPPRVRQKGKSKGFGQTVIGKKSPASANSRILRSRKSLIELTEETPARTRQQKLNQQKK